MFQPIRVDGYGIHTGAPSQVTLSPGYQGSGIVFEKEGMSIPVHPDHLHPDASRATTLCFGGVRIQTVEHLLAALLATGERDVRVQVSGPEIPVLDGSAGPWLERLQRAGLGFGFRFFPVSKVLNVTSGQSSAQIRPIGKGRRPRIEITLRLDAIGQPPMQMVFHPDVDDFRGIATARTFVFASDVERLRHANLARGGSLDNAVVMTEAGAINPGGLRFDNEPARHKVLDLIGDLAMLGALPLAEISVDRPGHHLHHKMVKALYGDIRRAHTCT